jgi:hypothetical protein
MRTGDAVLVLVCLLAAGLVAWNLAAPAAPAPSPPGAPAAGPDPAATERLREEIRRVEGRIETLERAKSELAPPPPAEPAGPGPDEPVVPPAVPERLAEEAARLGVPEALAAAAWEHYFRTKEGKGSPAEAAKRIVEAGPDGFRAVVALIRAGYRATWNRDLLRATYAPGLESHLLDLAREPDAERTRGSGYRSLAVADTEEVREFLVRAAGRETDPGALWGAAEALGDLHEPRGAAPLEGRFSGPGFSGVRPHILEALGRMGGEDAKRILVAHLRDPYGDALSWAIGALGWIDREAAREEAARILAGPRAKHLSGIDRRRLEEAAK